MQKVKSEIELLKYFLLLFFSMFLYLSNKKITNIFFNYKIKLKHILSKVGLYSRALKICVQNSLRRLPPSLKKK